MPRLELASTKITSELSDRLKRFTESTGLTQSAVIRQAIEKFLDFAESTGLTELTNIEGSFEAIELLAEVDPVDDRLTDIEARLEVLESRSPPSPPEPIAAVRTSPPKPKREPSIGIMGTTEAHQKLQAIGYSKSLQTFRRSMASAIVQGELPADLRALGLKADFETRRSANPKDNSVKWLSVCD